MVQSTLWTEPGGWPYQRFKVHLIRVGGDQAVTLPSLRTLILSWLAAIYCKSKNTQYIFEAYGQNYNGQAGQVNGNLADSLGSGLIDELGFFYSPFYYCNLSRGLASDDLVLKSISVVAQNISGYQLDLYVFITHKMDFTVDLRTGALV